MLTGRRARLRGDSALVIALAAENLTPRENLFSEKARAEADIAAGCALVCVI